MAERPDVMSGGHSLEDHSLKDEQGQILSRRIKAQNVSKIILSLIMHTECMPPVHG